VINRRQLLQGALFLPAVRAFAVDKPKQVLLIRHAEKTGDKADAHLNPRGYQRATALVRLFPAQFETPQFIFASRASGHSDRPVETVTPLARALHLNIDSRFPNEDYAGLARQLVSKPLYSGNTILVCWHHGNIPALAAALGVSHPPSPWPDTQFDRVWKIGYSDGGVKLEDLPQHLLDGDSL
jgi:phosphohistidine phosphatase SixA